MATVAGHKVTGKQVTVPPALHALLTTWTTIHDLSMQAAMHCDRDAARQALFLDPHVADLYDIHGIVEGFVSSMAEWLPEDWGRKG